MVWTPTSSRNSSASAMRPNTGRTRNATAPGLLARLNPGSRSALERTAPLRTLAACGESSSAVNVRTVVHPQNPYGRAVVVNSVQDAVRAAVGAERAGQL